MHSADSDLDDNDDVPIDAENGRRVAAAVAGTSPAAAESVREHEETHGEVLPTLLLDAMARWLVTSHGSDSDGDAWRVADAVEDLYRTGDDDLETIVVTGFLEAIPRPDDEGREVVERLPPALRDALRRMETADPPR